jgi:hypothetical protein
MGAREHATPLQLCRRWRVPDGGAAHDLAPGTGPVGRPGSVRPETPAKSLQDARFALTLVEQLPACAETLRVWLADANRGPSVA